MLQVTLSRGRHLIAAALLAQLLVLIAAGGARADDGGYSQTNLVSDVAGLAAHTDANLKNPWGLVHGPASPWWVADNGTGVSTLYNGSGETVLVMGSPLVVTIPPPAGSPAGTTAAPTGIVFNHTADFVVATKSGAGPSRFIFATEDGTISGWNPAAGLTNAVLEVDHSGSGAVYKGLALGQNRGSSFLFAANFHDGTVDVFNTNFKQVTPSGAFVDRGIPSGFAPFGIRNIDGKLFVTYAKQNAARHDDVAGRGNGFIDVFDTNGNLVKRLVSKGALDSPWGLTLAPDHFGKFSHSLLVGNFGDGRIHAYDAKTGHFRGTLRSPAEKPIVIEGLWGLDFGNGAGAGPLNTLFFTAGINGEKDGLFGSLQAVNQDEGQG
jgi:uncharacterized protein (TIGR03118 family)